MFKHEKKLLYEVKVEKPNPQYADILIILLQRLQALITQEDRFNFKVKRAVQILCTATSILKLNFIFFVHAYKVIW